MHLSIAHRPWPHPSGPWALAMEWHALLFAHWPVAPALLQRHLPPGLWIETWDGAAYLGVVPFRMAGVRPRLAPSVPWISAFPELNLRTYVTDGTRPGVWFFSLDAGNPLAVELARLGFHLPYYTAQMRCAQLGETIHYHSHRTHAGRPRADLTMTYAPGGPVQYAAPGTLAHWLTERYCLYAADRRGNLWRGEIHHARWPLQPATASFAHSTLTETVGLPLPATPPLLHYAHRLDVRAWLPERVRGGVTM